MHVVSGFPMFQQQEWSVPLTLKTVASKLTMKPLSSPQDETYNSSETLNQELQDPSLGMTTKSLQTQLPSSLPIRGPSFSVSWKSHNPEALAWRQCPHSMSGSEVDSK